MSNKMWEIIGYISLAMCIAGNILVGWFYLTAEFLFLISNIIATVRCFSLQQPTADKVRNISFVAMTIALIIIRLYA